MKECCQHELQGIRDRRIRGTQTKPHTITLLVKRSAPRTDPVISINNISLDITRKEVRTAEDYHNQPDREEHGCDSADETWRIFLVPGCCLRGQHHSATVAAFSFPVSCPRTRPLQVIIRARCKRSRDCFDSPKAQQGASHERIEEHFVQSHMGLLASYP